MKKLELNQMENVNGGFSPIAFDFMCGGMAYVLGTLTFGLGLLAGVACYVLEKDAK